MAIYRRWGGVGKEIRWEGEVEVAWGRWGGGFKDVGRWFEGCGRWWRGDVEAVAEAVSSGGEKVGSSCMGHDRTSWE